MILVGANSNISVDEFISSIVYFDGIEGQDYLRLTHTEGKGKMQGVPIFNGIPCIFSCFLEAYVLY